MKRTVILLVGLLALLSVVGLSNGLRLGIAAVDNYGGGAMITDVYYGYPAYGQIYQGDVITHVGYYSGNVVMFNGYCTMGNVKVYVNRPQGQRVYGSQHLQSLILGAPYNTVVTLWINRGGYTLMLVIQLRNPNSGNEQVMMMMVKP